MAQIVKFDPCMEKGHRSQVHAIVTIPTEVRYTPRPLILFRLLTEAIDAIVSLGLGVLLLIFIFLLIISL